jgi:hypothetical protein
MTGSSLKLLKPHSRNKGEMMTAGSIFVRTAAIAVRTGRFLMNRRHKPTEGFLTEGNKGNEGEGGQAVDPAWLTAAFLRYLRSLL